MSALGQKQTFCAAETIFPLKLKTTHTVYTACIMKNLSQPTIRSS